MRAPRFSALRWAPTHMIMHISTGGTRHGVSPPPPSQPPPPSDVCAAGARGRVSSARRLSQSAHGNRADAAPALYDVCIDHTPPIGWCRVAAIVHRLRGHVTPGSCLFCHCPRVMPYTRGVRYTRANRRLVLAVGPGRAEQLTGWQPWARARCGDASSACCLLELRMTMELCKSTAPCILQYVVLHNVPVSIRRQYQGAPENVAA